MLSVRDSNRIHQQRFQLFIIFSPRLINSDLKNNRAVKPFVLLQHMRVVIYPEGLTHCRIPRDGASAIIFTLAAWLPGLWAGFN